MGDDYKIITGNCLDKLKELDDNSIDAIVTDPPYDLVSINKRFGKENSAECKYGNDGSFQRLSKGFMGKEWDGTGIAFKKEVWEECLRVLKHGGHLFSFGGTRTFHRMTCAIEDAGFEIRDCVFWTYGSGFPKSLNIGKAYDKLKGNDREVIGSKKGQGNIPNDRGNWGLKPNEDVVVDKGTSEWEGWGTALKPAVEPIVMARKPLKEKTIVENVIKWGVGGINIDESRIAPIGMTKGGCKFKSAFFESGDSNFNKEFDESKGRFPANLIWTHHPDCKCVGTKEVNSNAHYPEMNVTGYGKNFGGKTEYLAEGERPKSEIVESWECVEGCPSKEFDKAGVSKTKANENYKWNNVNCENANTFTGRDVYTPRNDEGTPARFFKSFSYEQEDLDYAPFYYCAKASKSERNEGLDGGRESRKNFHPTVKPIKLMEYLIKMVTPKGGIVLDPFMGSGTTGCACVKNGYKFIGIEMTEEYIPIAEARIKAHVPTQQKLEGIE
jgi:DNA modification methylase